MSKKEINITGTHNRRGIRFCNKDKYITKQRKIHSDISCNFNQDDIKILIPKLYLKMGMINDFSLDSLDHLEIKILEEIKVKQLSYINQDSRKKSIVRENRENRDKITTEQIVEKLLTSSYKCYYCKGEIQILYENTREPKQWTLERLNNSQGHNRNNVVIACLSCNLQRRTMATERYLKTKEMTKIVKLD